MSIAGQGRPKERFCRRDETVGDRSLARIPFRFDRILQARHPELYRAPRETCRDRHALPAPGAAARPLHIRRTRSKNFLHRNVMSFSDNR